MTCRLITDIRRKQLERVAAALIAARFPNAQVQAEKGLIIITDWPRVACLCLRGSSADLSKEKRVEHGRLRKRNIPVFVCRSDSEIQFALDSVPKMKKARLA